MAALAREKMLRSYVMYGSYQEAYKNWLIWARERRLNNVVR